LPRHGARLDPIQAAMRSRAPDRAPHGALDPIVSAVERLERVRGDLGDDDARQAADHDLDAAGDVHPAPRSIHILEANGEALDVRRELA